MKLWEVLFRGGACVAHGEAESLIRKKAVRQGDYFFVSLDEEVEPLDDMPVWVGKYRTINEV